MASDGVTSIGWWAFYGCKSLTIYASAGSYAKTYTEEEVLALIQSESDKRVTQALKTERKKYEK